jgi:hypothetical protein
VGFGPLQSVVSYVLRPLVRSAGPAPSRRNRIASGPRGSASREVLAPSNTTTPGAPSPSRPSLRSIVRDEDRQTLVGAVLRVLAPLDGASCLAARSRPFGPRRSPWPPTLRGLLSCRSRPWSVPSELSLPEEPYPLSRAVSSLRVRVRLPPAQCPQELHDRFPRFSRQLFAFEPARKRTRDA